MPHVIKEAAALLSDRLTLQAGDFFADLLPVSDAYLLMEVIHDWGDDDSVAILKAIRRAAPAHSKLLVIEQIVPDDPGPHWSRCWISTCWFFSVANSERDRNTNRCFIRQDSYYSEKSTPAQASPSWKEAPEIGMHV